ncbi:MAG: GNAT family N-acetyltransferase [Oscillospiraceae bacterium]|nr:GNAT family N-acetyltransferase [Oscillospiraceae bacterium]
MVYPDKGYIGCFEMADMDIGKRQLEAYTRELLAAGHRRVIAPINGDTWHSYRLVSWSGGEAAFPLEPQNPLWYNDVYKACGYKPLKRYSSDAFYIGGEAEPRGGVHAPGKRGFLDGDLLLRGFRDGSDIRTIYDISLRGFDDNFLYSEISYEAFEMLYKPFLPSIDSDLAIIAEIGGKPAGFMFSYVSGGRLILKTIAVLPDFRGRGVGAAMVGQVVQAGRAKGLRTAIAALIAEGNNSFNIISKYGSDKIREYTLYYYED